MTAGALPAHVLNEARALGFSEDGVLMDDDTTSEANSERAYLVEEDDEMKAGIKILMSNTLARHGRTVAFDDQDADDLDLSSGTAVSSLLKSGPEGLERRTNNCQCSQLIRHGP